MTGLKQDWRPRSVVRRLEKDALYAAGAQARRDGKTIHQKPRMGMLDAIQWTNGWEDADRELQGADTQP